MSFSKNECAMNALCQPLLGRYETDVKPDEQQPQTDVRLTECCFHSCQESMTPNIRRSGISLVSSWIFWDMGYFGHETVLYDIH
jgi:hypothetical protein